MRYSSSYNSEIRKGFQASADRGLASIQDNKPIRESILTYDDIENSINISSVDSKGYIRSDNNDSQTQTIVFANTDNNGKNENNTDSLDWKYVFLSKIILQKKR